MASVCISSCVDDARDPRIPARATYVNLYKWPESDPEFIKSVRRVTRGLPVDDDGNGHSHSRHHRHGARVVDCISCRQMYLRSYTFSRKESPEERTTRGSCSFGGKVREKVAINGSSSSSRNSNSSSSRRRRPRKKCLVLRRVKEVSCNALLRFFHRLLSCSASVDVVDQVD